RAASCRPPEGADGGGSRLAADHQQRVAAALRRRCAAFDPTVTALRASLLHTAALDSLSRLPQPFQPALLAAGQQERGGDGFDRFADYAFEGEAESLSFLSGFVHRVNVGV